MPTTNVRYAVVLVDLQNSVKEVMPMTMDEWCEVCTHDALSTAEGKFYMNTRHTPTQKNADGVLRVVIFAEISTPVVLEKEEAIFHA